MTRKEQNKILDAKIESNVNQYKVDRLNAEISAFSSGDLNKYEFLKRIDLNYKPNALDKARFEFSPLGKTFSMGLDKTAQGYQEEGIIKLLKDIRDGLAGGIIPKRPGSDNDNDNDDNDNDDNDDNDNDNDDNDNYNNMPDLETEEEAAKRIAKTNISNKFNEIFRDKENKFDKFFKDKENKLNNNVTKLKNSVEENNDKEKELDHIIYERDLINQMKN